MKKILIVSIILFFCFYQVNNLYAQTTTDYSIRNVFTIVSTDTVIWGWNSITIPAVAYVEYGISTDYGQKSTTAICSQYKNEYDRNCKVTISGLSPQTNYHFRIINQTEMGVDILQPTLRINLAPSKPLSSDPRNGRIFLPQEVNAFNKLDWIRFENMYTIKYDVFLKYNSNQFTTQDMICHDIYVNSCGITPLQAGTYYWKVIAYDPITNISTEGDIWTFTLQAAQSSSTATPTTPTTTTPTTPTPTTTTPVTTPTTTTSTNATQFVQQEKSLVISTNTTLVNRLNGYILLQVQEHGEAWYVDPKTDLKYYLPDGTAAYSALRKFGLGITNADLSKIPVGIESRFQDVDTDGDGLPDKLEEGLGTNPNKSDSDGDGYSDLTEVQTGYNPLGSGKLTLDTALANRLKGRIVLQVQSRGEAWYINPKDGKRYYMKDGEAAYQIMRFLSLGITNTDLRQIPVGTL